MQTKKLHRLQSNCKTNADKVMHQRKLGIPTSAANLLWNKSCKSKNRKLWSIGQRKKRGRKSYICLGDFCQAASTSSAANFGTPFVVGLAAASLVVPLVVVNTVPCFVVVAIMSDRPLASTASWFTRIPFCCFSFGPKLSTEGLLVSCLPVHSFFSFPQLLTTNPSS